MANPIVTITMENGDVMKAELYPDVAPITVENFVNLVKDGFYDGLTFHRVINGFMIQGGCPLGTGTGGPGHTIKGEFSQNGVINNLKHTPGVLSMARSMMPDSAGSQFFIMHKAAPHLDGQYAAFGKIIEDMKTVTVEEQSTISLQHRAGPSIFICIRLLIFINIQMGNDNMSENNKLIFLDVDATLYSKEQRLVPESAITAIHAAQKNGHKVLINTGRPLVYFEKEILDIGCDGYLCSNGVHILLDGETIYHKIIPDTVVEQIKRICEENNIYGTFEGEKCSYFRDHNVDFHPHYGFMITAFELAPYMAHEFTWDHVEDPDKAIVFTGPGSNASGFVAALDSISDTMDYIRIDDTQYEILLKDHDKGTGLKYVADHLDISTDDCYAFGDSNNDISMFKAAGHSIAMGNSCDELKEIAEYVTDSVNDDGLYNAFEHYHLI